MPAMLLIWSFEMWLVLLTDTVLTCWWRLTGSTEWSPLLRTLPSSWGLGWGHWRLPSGAWLHHWAPGPWPLGLTRSCSCWSLLICCLCVLPSCLSAVLNSLHNSLWRLLPLLYRGLGLESSCRRRGQYCRLMPVLNTVTWNGRSLVSS